MPSCSCSWSRAASTRTSTDSFLSFASEKCPKASLPGDFLASSSSVTLSIVVLRFCKLWPFRLLSFFGTRAGASSSRNSSTSVFSPVSFSTRLNFRINRFSTLYSNIFFHLMVSVLILSRVSMIFALISGIVFASFGESGLRFRRSPADTGGGAFCFFSLSISELSRTGRYEGGPLR